MPYSHLYTVIRLKKKHFSKFTRKLRAKLNKKKLLKWAEISSKKNVTVYLSVLFLHERKCVKLIQLLIFSSKHIHHKLWFTTDLLFETNLSLSLNRSDWTSYPERGKTFLDHFKILFDRNWFIKKVERKKEKKMSKREIIVIDDSEDDEPARKVPRSSGIGHHN